MNILWYPFSTILLVFLDVFAFQQSSDVRICGIVLLYILCVKYRRLMTNTTFILSILFLFIAYVQFLFVDYLLLINPGVIPTTAERFAVWAFIFLLIGVGQSWKNPR